MSLVSPDTIKVYLAEIYGLDQEDVIEIYEAAQETIIEGLSKLELDVKQQNCSQTAESLHLLKGSFLNMGLVELAEQFKNFEQQAKQGKLDILQDSLSTLKQTLAPIIS